VFNPTKRRGQGRYTDLRQVGRVISKIGRAAEVFVTDDGKPASAHDLRRSFGQRMADAGLPPRDLQAIMRHSSMATTEKYYLTNRASDQAERIAKYLGTHQTINEKRTADESPQVLS
ncbi:MAG: site-specific integrase, partial [Pirellulaceae bacterium]|nr:site-specific integrase [Pirellulaceae bacterium]